MKGRDEREKVTYRSGVHVKEARDALCPSTQQMFCLNNELYQKWTAEENERKRRKNKHTYIKIFTFAFINMIIATKLAKVIRKNYFIILNTISED